MRLRLVGTAVVGLLLRTLAHAQAPLEEKQKAEYLYNFTKFVEWPPETFKRPTDPFVIGVFGSDAVRDALAAAVAGKTFQSRSFQIRMIADAGQAAACQILFVGGNGPKRLSWFLTEMANLPMLTVGEADNFVAAGGVVNFKTGSADVRLQINIKAARQQHLRISSQLLNLVEVAGR